MEHSFYNNKVLPSILPLNNRLYIIHEYKPELISFKYDNNGGATAKIKFRDNKDISSNTKNIYVRGIDASAKESIEEQIEFAIGSQEKWDEKRKAILIKSANEAIKNIDLYYRSLNDKINKLSKYGYSYDKNAQYDDELLNKISSKLNKLKGEN